MGAPPRLQQQLRQLPQHTCRQLRKRLRLRNFCSQQRSQWCPSQHPSPRHPNQQRPSHIRNQQRRSQDHSQWQPSQQHLSHIRSQQRRSQRLPSRGFQQGGRVRSILHVASHTTTTVMGESCGSAPRIQHYQPSLPSRTARFLPCHRVGAALLTSGRERSTTIIAMAGSRGSDQGSLLPSSLLPVAPVCLQAGVGPPMLRVDRSITTTLTGALPGRCLAAPQAKPMLISHRVAQANPVLISHNQYLIHHTRQLWMVQLGKRIM